MSLATDSGTHSAAIQDQALAWFARLRDSRLGDAERNAFNVWLSANSEHRAAYDKVSQLWQSPAFEAALSRYAAIPLEPAHRRIGAQRWAAAACVLLVAGWLLIAFGLIQRWQADYATAGGEQRRVQLADGSNLVLNTDSAVRLDYDEGRRGVQLLQGEAYFEVEPDKNRPFIVSTADASVRVVGTRFSVRRVDATLVDVETGIVDCTDRYGNNRQLTAGQHIRIDRQGVAQPADIDSIRSFAWLHGRLIFKDQPLTEVIAGLDRYHPGIIVITDAALGQVRITGNYKLDDTAAIIRTLAEITGAKTFNLSPYLTLLKS
jgi:transmembrane sensor